MLWGLEELRQTAEMVKGIAEDAMKYGDFETREAGYQANERCRSMLGFIKTITRYMNAGEGSQERQNNV